MSAVKHQLSVNDLPEEIVIYIFLSLSPKELANVAKVSKFFNRLAKTESLWINFLNKINNKKKSKINARKFFLENPSERKIKYLPVDKQGADYLQKNYKTSFIKMLALTSDCKHSKIFNNSRQLEELKKILENLSKIPGFNLNTFYENLPINLYESIKNRNNELLELLVYYGADVNKPYAGHDLLSSAADCGNIVAYNYLLDNGARFELGSLTNNLKSQSKIFWCNKTFIEALFKKNVDINKSYEKGITVLHKVAAFGTSELTKMLIQKGARVDGEMLYDSPLHSAAEKNNIETLKTLIENNAAINSRGNNEETALFRAVSNNCVGAVKLLLENGAAKAVNKSNIYLIKPLVSAINCNCSPEIFQFLLEHGANVEPSTEWDHNRPMYLAIKGNNKQLAMLLLLFNATTCNLDSNFIVNNSSKLQVHTIKNKANECLESFFQDNDIKKFNEFIEKLLEKSKKYLISHWPKLSKEIYTYIKDPKNSSLPNLEKYDRTILSLTLMCMATAIEKKLEWKKTIPSHITKNLQGNIMLRSPMSFFQQGEAPPLNPEKVTKPTTSLIPSCIIQ